MITNKGYLKMEITCPRWLTYGSFDVSVDSL